VGDELKKGVLALVPAIQDVLSCREVFDATAPDTSKQKIHLVPDALTTRFRKALEIEEPFLNNQDLRLK
jgi:hypothetical protein